MMISLHHEKPPLEQVDLNLKSKTKMLGRKSSELEIAIQLL